MTRVENLTVKPGDREGQLLARWKRVRGNAAYYIEVSTESTPKNWKPYKSSTKAKCILDHSLVSGQKVWVRVRAFGARNDGAWSQPVRVTVP